MSIPLRPVGGTRANPAYFEVYPHLWQSDIGIRLSSLAARGLWFDLLQLFLTSPRRGELRAEDGTPLSAADLAARFSMRLRSGLPEMESMLDELVTNGLIAVRDGMFVATQMEGRK